MITPKIAFAKMHALGNDFVIINTLNQDIPSHLPISLFADRHRGIGFDQLLLIEKSDRADFFCRIFNADGSIASQCGNGLRCVARYLHEFKLHAQPFVHIETLSGIYPLSIKEDGNIEVEMGIPIIQEPLLTLELLSPIQKIQMSILSMGNPHAIIPVENIQNISSQLAAEISTLSYFPSGVNIGFMQIINANLIKLRTYERGVGETFSCGSNACAASVAGIINGWLGNCITIQTVYGSLQVSWLGNHKDTVHLSGPASFSFVGEMMI